MSTSLRLVPPAPAPALPPLDPEQRSVLEHPSDGGHLLVVGAPGSGKTTAAMALLENRLSRGAAHGDVLMLVPTRRGATRIRDQVSGRLGHTMGDVLVRTPASIAFSILRARASLLGEPSPTLLTGPEQDAILADLLAGHRAGLGAAPSWPERIPESARGLSAFRNELRDLLMRAAEAGLTPAALASLGRRRRREEWVAAAAVLKEYEHVLQLGQLTPDRGERYDAALIVDEAVAALRSWSRDVPAAPPPRFAAVIVDDYQDATLATARLLRALADDGGQIVLFGDADVAVQRFRGGAPSLLTSATAGRDQAGGLGATRVVLRRVWRQQPALREVTAAVTGCLSTTAGAAHRRAKSAWTSAGTADEELGNASGEEDSLAIAAAAPASAAGVEVAVLRTPAEEAALIARTFREERLRRGTPCSRMAVIVRGAAQSVALRRRLSAAGVRVAVDRSERALRDEPAVAPLLTAVGAALTGGLDAERGLALLMSPLAGGDRLDSVSVRALRRALRAQVDTEDRRSTDELLTSALTEPSMCEALPIAVRAAPARISAVIEAARTAAQNGDATAESVLWAAWDAAGVAGLWRRTALAGGPGSVRADRYLDAVLDLFQEAERFCRRHPGARPEEFVRFVERQDLSADTLAEKSANEDAVQVLTAAGAAGREWDVVAVAGLQEGVWPDLRLRDSLLGAHDLADVAAGRAASHPVDGHESRHEVLQDELRAFAVAVSRARRRLLLTAVRDGDVLPSPFLEIVDPRHETDGERPLTPAPAPLDLRGLVAVLRAELLAAGGTPTGSEVPAGDAGVAAELLAHLAGLGIRGADPAEWVGGMAVSTDAPLWGSGSEVELSPSALETARSCALRWALEQAGGRRPAGAEQDLGTLVHEIAAEHPHGTHAELQDALDRRWPELRLGEGWVARRRRALAEEMIRRLADYMATRPGRVDTEQVVRAEVGGAVVRGRVDRVEHLADGTVRLVDLKTGRSAKPTAEAEVDLQLGAYQAAVRQGALGDGVRPGGAALVYVGMNKEAAQRHQKALEDDWVEATVAEIGHMAAGSSFAATVGAHCRSCGVRTSCPASAEGAREAAP